MFCDVALTGRPVCVVVAQTAPTISSTLGRAFSVHFPFPSALTAADNLQQARLALRCLLFAGKFSVDVSICVLCSFCFILFAQYANIFLISLLVFFTSVVCAKLCVPRSLPLHPTCGWRVLFLPGALSL
jgi:hypothetical protein